MGRGILFTAAAVLVALGCSSGGGVGAGAPPGDAPGDPGSTSGGAPSASSGGGPAPTSSSGGPTPPAAPDSVGVVVEPSDHASALLTAIQGAKKSVHVTMYLLDDSRFTNALIAQKKAGRDVKVMLNQSFPQQTGSGGNGSVYSQLQAAGVSVAWAPSGFTLTHEKCVILDGSEAWIMTMNLEASSPSNREYLAIDKEPADVAEAEAIFDADFSNHAYTATGNLVVAPDNARTKLVALIQSAKTSVDIEGEELSDYQIVNALLAAQKAGVAVRIVLSDTTPTPAQTTAVQQLTAAKIQVVTLSSPYVHAKTLIVDAARAYIGSANFTTSSLVSNRELGLVTDNPSTVSEVAKTVAADIAAGK